MFDGLPRTRAEAREAGSKRYFTGKPCKHGHVDKRLTSDGRCFECARIDSLQRFYADRESRNEKAKAYAKKRYAEDPEYRAQAIAYQASYRSSADNREKVLKREAVRRAARTPEDRLRIRIYMREYQLKRHRASPKARLNRSISGGIYKSLTARGYSKADAWESLVGFTLDELRIHLERQFQPGMTWENYGDWHIDHRIPKSAFNYETPDDIDFKRCWALSNLQPMWAKDNIKKGAKLSAPFQPSLALGVRDHHTTSE